jgi:hypothetical protein
MPVVKGKRSLTNVVFVANGDDLETLILQIKYKDKIYDIIVDKNQEEKLNQHITNKNRSRESMFTCISCSMK